MSNSDELIEKLLDGTLGDDELQSLEKMMVADAGMAEDVRELLRVEEVLWRNADATFAASDQFRENVAVKVKERMRAEAGAPALTGTRFGAAVASFLSRSRWGSGLVAATMLVGAGFVVGPLMTDEMADEESARSNPAIEEPHEPMAYLPYGEGMIVELPAEDFDADGRAEEVSETPIPPSVDALPLAAESAAQSSASPAAAPVTTTAVSSSKPTSDMGGDEFQAQVDDPASAEEIDSRYDSRILKLKQRIADNRNAGDAISLGTLSKQLGLVQRLAGNYDASRSALEESLAIAKNKGIRDLEADVLSELAQLNLAQGHQGSALLLMRRCLEIKKELQTDDVQHWERKVAELSARVR